MREYVTHRSPYIFLFKHREQFDFLHAKIFEFIAAHKNILSLLSVKRSLKVIIVFVKDFGFVVWIEEGEVNG